MKSQLNEVNKLQKTAGIKINELFGKASKAPDDQINYLSSVFNFMPDDVVYAAEDLEKELKKVGVKFSGELINAIKDLVVAARNSK